MFAFARIATMLLLALREDHLMRTYPSQVEHGGRRFRRAPAISRSLTTLFGAVRYARTYMRSRSSRPAWLSSARSGARAGRRPVQLERTDHGGAAGDKLSFAEARATLASFGPNAPSTEVIENTVLGLGRHTAAWFEQAPAPEGDGEVLVIMFDGTGAPTATESELSRRRGKRRRQRLPASPRHRGRHHRRRYDKKPRRKKGDKSKNARIEAMHTIDVMHVIEKLWTAGECLFREGTDPLRQWIDVQKDRLYTGKGR